MSTTAALIREWRVEHCEKPSKALRPDYINRTVAKAWVRRSYIFSLTDLGNAERFVRDHGEDIRYCAPFGQWYLWNGQRWCGDTTLAIYQRARSTVRSIYREAAACNDASRRKLIAQHARASESEHRIKAMVSLARSDASVAVTPDCFDRGPFAFNCRMEPSTYAGAKARCRLQEAYRKPFWPPAVFPATLARQVQGALPVVTPHPPPGVGSGQQSRILIGYSSCAYVHTAVVTARVLSPDVIGSNSVSFAKPSQRGRQQLHVQRHQEGQVRPEKERVEAVTFEVADKNEEENVRQDDRRQKKEKRHTYTPVENPLSPRGCVRRPPLTFGPGSRLTSLQEPPGQETLGEGEKNKVVRPRRFQDERDS